MPNILTVALHLSPVWVSHIEVVVYATNDMSPWINSYYTAAARIPDCHSETTVMLCNAGRNYTQELGAARRDRCKARGRGVPACAGGVWLPIHLADVDARGQFWPD